MSRSSFSSTNVTNDLITNNAQQKVDFDELSSNDEESDSSICEKSYAKTADLTESDAIGANKTPIQQFYSGQSILITGGSGFLGKILIEKLLRTCNDIIRIYVLIRSQSEKDIEGRLNDIFQNVVFDRLKIEVPDFRSKIVPIKGDLSADKLGLSINDDTLLRRNVSIVFHVGASVRFNEDLKSAMMTNINATKYLLHMAKSMENLKAFIFVSTAFTNCYLKHIEERFYTYPIDHQTFCKLIKDLPPKEANKRINKAFSAWPNTYVRTKAVAESLVRDASKELPIGILRPSVVSSTADEPFAGWIGNYYGTVGVIISNVKGLLKMMICNPNYTANLVPVDKTMNAAIVAAWDVFNKPERRGDETLIYNYTSNDAPFTWAQYKDEAKKKCNKYLGQNINLILIKNKILFNICNWFVQILPAILLNIRKKDLNIQSMRKLYNNILLLIETFEYFTTRNWTYTNYNVQEMWSRLNREDRQLFNFNMKGFNWSQYLDDHFKGIYIYLLKRNIDISKANHDTSKRFCWTDIIIYSLFLLACLAFIYIMLPFKGTAIE